MKFNYPVLEQITRPDFRVYKTPDGDCLPSVTTILSKTKDMTKLLEWRESIGEIEADKITDRSKDIGTQMHNAIESYLKNTEPNFSSNMRGKFAKSMFLCIKKNFLCKIEKAVGVEVPLYFPGLYAGTVDLIAIIDGNLVVIDWKNSRKPKKREWIEDYFIQGASYVLAHDELFDTKINTVKIVLAVQPDSFGKIEYAEYSIQGEKLESYKEKWLKRVENFYEKFDKSSFQV